MKTLIKICVFLFVGLVSAQEKNQSVTNNTEQVFGRASNAGLSSYGTSSYFYNPKRLVEGSEFLFHTWKNHAVIHTKSNHKFLLTNINLLIPKNSFASKISKDSIYLFDMNTIEKVVVNGKTYKMISSIEGERIYQIIYTRKDFTILKGFKTKTILGSDNPMINRKTDKIVKKEYHYILRGEELLRFKLKKSNVLKLLNKEKQQLVKDYAKKHKLSFKKEFDLQKILNYYSCL